MSKKSRLLNGEAGNKLGEALNKKLRDLDKIYSLNLTEAKVWKEIKNNVSLLHNVASGLYLEADKLCKKNPKLIASDYLVDQTNLVIKETKEIVEGDSFVDRLTQIIPAGENPDIPDVVIRLNQVKSGLERYKNIPEREIKEYQLERQEIELIRECLFSLLTEGLELTIEEASFGKNHSEWFKEEIPYCFNFEDLNETDLFDHFGYEEGDEEIEKT
ncbi:MAG: hypothetical protein JSS81_06030 [Acidobacteria bacterium]|nr:hypothetical protein [Acidobacteriota bacterium]